MADLDVVARLHIEDPRTTQIGSGLRERRCRKRGHQENAREKDAERKYATH